MILFWINNNKKKIIRDGDFFDPNQPKNRYEELQNMISKWKKGYLYEKPPKGESPVEVNLFL